MSDGEHYNTLVKLVENQRDETRELRNAVTDMSKSISRFASLLTKLETLHEGHDDGMKRIGKVLDDHETRIRSNEKAVVKMTVIASVASFAVGIAVNIGLKVLL